MQDRLKTKFNPWASRLGLGMGLTSTLRAKIAVTIALRTLESMQLSSASKDEATVIIM
jgi:hypothetical protein